MTFTAPTDDSLETTAQIRTDKLGPQPCPRRRRRSGVSLLPVSCLGKLLAYIHAGISYPPF